MGLPTWTCPFRVFQHFGGGETLPIMLFAFSNLLLGRVYPPVMSLSHFSTCRGGETLLVTSHSLFSTCWGGETFSSCLFRIFRHAVVEKPSSSHRVCFFRHAGVGKSSPFTFLMFQGEKTLSIMSYLPFLTLSVFFCKLLKIYYYFNDILEG